MKILMLANEQGGLYKFRRELIEAFLERGYQVFLSIPDGDRVPFFRSIGCRIFETDINRRGINPREDIRLFRRYSGIMKEIRPDLVITYTIKPNIYGGIAARLHRIRYAANITGLGTAFQNRGILRTAVIRLYKTALRKAKVIFFENSANRDEMLHFRICDKKQTCVLAGAGVNTVEYYYQEYPENPKFRFLFVGRVMKEKGINELFEAIRRLKEEDHRNCILDVVGSFEEDYQEAVHRAETSGFIAYHGSQADVRPFYGQCDCFVLPSWHEGMANTNLEAAASGRPVITSDIPGCQEAVHAGVSGLLCRPKNVENLYQAMKTMMEFPAAQRTAMGLAGRKRMEDQFDKQLVVKQTIDRIQ